MKQRRIANDAATRRLRCGGDPEAMDKILQDECRRRASQKLAATLLCPDFRFPTALSAEQCTSDAVAAFHASMIPEGAKVIDLTCGLGIDAFHCAARAATVMAIDRDPLVAEAILPNAQALGLHNVSACCADCVTWLEDNPRSHFDVAFIDPARRGEGGRRLYGLHDCSPDVVAMLPLIASHSPRLIVKASPMLDITKLLRDEALAPSQMLVIGTRSECKELVLDFDFAAPVSDPLIRAVTIGEQEFQFRAGAIRGEFLPAAEVEPDCLIGEPWPAVMKAGAYGGAYNLIPGRRLHPDTHLYLLDRSEAGSFPGDVYRVERVEPFSSSLIKRLGRAGVDGSVAVKNFPMSADELRRRLKARENSSRRIVGATALKGRLLLSLVRC